MPATPSTPVELAALDAIPDQGFHAADAMIDGDAEPLVLYRDGETRAFHDLATDWSESFRLGAHDFVDALLAGRPPEQSLAEARRTLAFALAAGRSAAERREVSLAEILA